MAVNEASDPALARALKRRKELQDTIRASLQEVDKIENWLRTYREFAGDFKLDSESEQKTMPLTSFGRAAWGSAQQMFEHFVREILMERGVPMQANEVLAEFQKRGHPLGGSNELKQTWNRLWQAKVNGVLVHFPRPGYWVAGEPIPESEAVRARAEIDAGLRPKPKERKSRVELTRKSNPRAPGRAPMLSEHEVKLGEKWILEGKYSTQEICNKLGGISSGTFYRYFPGGQEAVRKAHGLFKGVDDNEM